MAALWPAPHTQISDLATGHVDLPSTATTGRTTLGCAEGHGPDEDTKEEEEQMDLDRTTLSGGGLTLITQGGRPVGRRTAETWFEARGITTSQTKAAPSGGRPVSGASAHLT